jgi:hypothetical protein
MDITRYQATLTNVKPGGDGDVDQTRAFISLNGRGW